MLWSVLSPMLTLLVMSLVFKHFFGNDTPHYTIYLFCGNIIFSFFSDSTSGGMGALLANADIFTKIKLPKCQPKEMIKGMGISFLPFRIVQQGIP
jgi:ABC-type polysaccharide/polyol phosphate export permease